MKWMLLFLVELFCFRCAIEAVLGARFCVAWIYVGLCAVLAVAAVLP